MTINRGRDKACERMDIDDFTRHRCYHLIP